MAENESSMKCGDGGGSGVNCDEAVHQLYHYLDGELTEDKRNKIAVHLDNCSPCGSAAHFEAELRHVISSKCHDHVPESLKERIAASINEEALHVGDS